VKQEVLNKEMVSEGITKYRSKTNQAKSKQRETASSAGATLLRNSVHDVSVEMAQWIKQAKTKPGVNHSSVKLLDLFQPELSSFIVCRCLLDCISSRRPLTATAIAIGAALEDEARFTKMHKEKPETWRAIRLECDRKIGYSLRRLVANHRVKQAGFVWKWWTPTEKLHLGMACIEVFRKATGLIDIEAMYERGNKKCSYIVASSITADWIEKYDKFNEQLNPTLMPMVEPPKVWKDGNPYGGGYGDGVFSERPCIVKTRNRAFKRLIENHSMPVVYEAINRMQGTKWIINKKLLDIVCHFWDNGYTANNVLPNSNLMEIPTKPLDIADNSDARKAWKRQAAKVYEFNAKNKSKRLQVARTVTLAKKLQDAEAIYFPYQIDFRGRVYALPYFLTPQGTDLARGLLIFKEGKKLDETAWAYLKLHGANCYGLDKAPLEERIGWVDENKKAILSTAKDPLGNVDFWSAADEPWQFLAWVFEFGEAVEKGGKFVSRLPISLDASNNGLQILSLLMRDTDGAEATNCLPSTHPRDIYADVAHRVIEKLKEKDDSLARAWLQFGITRKTTKRPVMILPYGGTYTACRIYLEEWLDEELLKRSFPADVTSFRACVYLTPIVWASIKEVVGKAQECMGWFQQVARACCKAKIDIRWVTPSGFPVVQDYPKSLTKMVKSTLAGKVRYHKLAVDQRKMSMRRQVNGISPNYVHSLDSACLHQTVFDLPEIKNFAMIHDSFGVVAADAKSMAETLRKVYAKIFRENLLNKFREEINKYIEGANKMKRHSCILPPLPKLGDLDVSKLELSNYFFS